MSARQAAEKIDRWLYAQKAMGKWTWEQLAYRQADVVSGLLRQRNIKLSDAKTILNAWGKNPRFRGHLVEGFLSKTELSGWKHMRQKYPLIDFTKGKVVRSLKTVDTVRNKSDSWFYDMRKAIRGFRDSTDPVVTRATRRELDIRVPRGGTNAGETQTLLKTLRGYADSEDVSLVITITEF